MLYIGLLGFAIFISIFVNGYQLFGNWVKSRELEELIEFKKKNCGK